MFTVDVTTLPPTEKLTLQKCFVVVLVFMYVTHLSNCRRRLSMFIFGSVDMFSRISI